MKSAYELAMERLEKSAPPVKLNDEQRAELADIETKFKAKIAEKEVFLDGLIAKATAENNFEELSQLQVQKATRDRPAEPGNGRSEGASALPGLALKSFQFLQKARLGRACADDLVFHFAVFEEKEERDGSHVVFRGQTLSVVDVDLADFETVANFAGHFVQNRSDHLAGAAPFCPEVDENGFVGLFNFSGEIVFSEFKDGFVSHDRWS